jgi:PAS domain S-box-containing protein
MCSIAPTGSTPPRRFFVYEVTEDGRFLLKALNPAHEQLSGIKIETARGREPHEFLPPDAAAEVTRKYRRCVETAESMRYEQELSMSAGVRTWETMLVPVRAPNADRVSRLLGSCREISEVKRFVAALSESEQRFRHIADGAPVLIWISGPDKARTYVNKPWLDFTGRSLEMELGDGWAGGVHPDDLARCLAVYQSHFDRRESFRMEYRLKRADGQYRWIDDSGVPRFGTVGDFLGYMGSAVDITERRATEQALRQLAGRLLKMQDEERRRIARDLHDSTAQNLLGAILGIRRARRLDRGMPDEAKRVLEESHDLIRQTEREVRTTCYLLHPPMLDEAGLPAAVRWYVEGFAKRSRIKVDIDIAAELSERRLPQDVEIALFRVVQEALTNVRRHSGSKKARLSLMRSNDDVSLTIEDDGRGMTGVALAFAAGKPHGGIAGLGLGIAGMSERLRQLGGSLHVHSQSRGVRVTAIVPDDRQS